MTNNTSFANISQVTSLSGTSDLVKFTTWISNYLLNPILAYFLPIAVFLTIVNNVLVITIFSCSREVTRRITPSIRVYYLATAIADIIVCIPIHLTYFVEDGLAYISNGKFGFYWDQVNSGVSVWFLTAETFTHWLSVALVGERLFALNWPFLARRVSSARKALLLCAFVLFFVAMLQMPVYTFGVYSILPSAAYASGYTCQVNLSVSSAFNIILNFTSVCGYSVYPEIVIIVLNSVLASSISRILNDRQEMVSGSKGAQGSGPGSGPGARREVNTAYLILVMASLPLLIYIPNALFWFPYVIASLFPNWSPQVSTLLAVLGRITLSMSILVHFWNIFIYFYRVTGFKQELVRIMTCGLVRPVIVGSLSSASFATEK